MSRYNRWKKDGTLDRILAALKFKPMPDSERHHRQGYGTIQRAQFSRMASIRGCSRPTTIPTSEG